MKPRTVFALSAAIVASMSAIFVSAGASDDQVIASFEREFQHESMPALPVTREAINSDMLYELVNKPLQTIDNPTERTLMSMETSHD